MAGSQWETVRAKLILQLQLQRGSKDAPRSKLPASKLPSGTQLWLSTGSKEGNIIVQLRQPPPRNMPDEEVRAIDEQLAADAVQLVNAALPAGRSATGRPKRPPRKRLAAVQAEWQGGLPAAEPQPVAKAPAAPVGIGSAGTVACRQ